jgi:hypothetical protein
MIFHLGFVLNLHALFYIILLVSRTLLTRTRISRHFVFVCLLLLLLNIFCFN